LLQPAPHSLRGRANTLGNLAHSKESLFGHDRVGT
jgi:hypothetical protein